jgi:hypothetical protein
VSKLPQPFWAVLLSFQGVCLCLCVLFHPSDVNLGLAVLTIGSNLVSGALGAFAGHATATSKADVTTGNAPVTINQTDPK